MNTASEKQIALIKRLTDERDLSQHWEPGMDRESDAAASCSANAALQAGRRAWATQDFDTRTASTVIEFLLAAPMKAAPAPAPAPEQDLEGMHRFGGVIFKVQRAVHGSGHLYAKELAPTKYDDEGNPTDWGFEYAPGAIRNLSEATRLTLADAKEFGALYGTCMVCGRTLTNEESIEAGIGPICRNKF